jgi:hypothetical protein
MGVCALFYPSAIFLIVFILFALLIFRPFFWREWAFVFIGLILPFYFTYAIIYLFNKPESANFLSSYIEILRYSCPSIHFSSVDRYVFYFVIFILLVSVMHVLSMMGNMKILARKSYYLFFILLLNLLAIYGLVPQAGKEISIMMAIPVSYLLSFYFNSGRLTRIKVIFFDILVLAIILAHYIH